MKGIILAGGSGTRLFPSTITMSKQILPVYDKPMIYYPLSTLIKCGLRDVLIISTPNHIKHFQHLIGNGDWIGMDIRYIEQPEPKGIAQAFILAKDWLGDNEVSLILGDNIFIGETVTKSFLGCYGGAVVLTQVADPRQYGVAKFKDTNLDAIMEKPDAPPSNLAVTGFYQYNSKVVDIAKDLKPSKRGELEISDVNNVYIENNDLYHEVLGPEEVWFDCGRPESLLDVSSYIHAYQKRTGNMVGCVELEALFSGFINENDFEHLYRRMPHCDYKSQMRKSYDNHLYGSQTADI